MNYEQAHAASHVIAACIVGCCMAVMMTVCVAGQSSRHVCRLLLVEYICLRGRWSSGLRLGHQPMLSSKQGDRGWKKQ